MMVAKKYFVENATLQRWRQKSVLSRLQDHRSHVGDGEVGPVCRQPTGWETLHVGAELGKRQFCTEPTGTKRRTCPVWSSRLPDGLRRLEVHQTDMTAWRH